MISFVAASGSLCSLVKLPFRKHLGLVPEQFSCFKFYLPFLLIALLRLVSWRESCSVSFHSFCCWKSRWLRRVISRRRFHLLGQFHLSHFYSYFPFFVNLYLLLIHLSQKQPPNLWFHSCFYFLCYQTSWTPIKPKD